MTAASQPLRTLRTRLAVVGSAALILGTVFPAVTAASAAWQLTRSPVWVVPAVATEVEVNAKNVSSGGEVIGCIKITIDPAFVVTSTQIVSAPAGKSWSTSFTGSPTVVTAVAASDPDRLKGSTARDAVDIGITVTGVAPGTYTWVARAYAKPDCGSDLNQPKSFSVKISLTNPLNVAPVASDDGYSVHAGTTLVATVPGVLANDVDANLDPLSAVLIAGPGNGTLVFPGDGSFSYVPSPGFVGIDSFTYQASDGAQNSPTATATIAVTNTGPSAVVDAATASKNVTLTVPAAGLLANDSDADGDVLSTSLATPPASGSATVAPDGSWTYTPNPSFVGLDGFTYDVTDGVATSSAAVVVTVVNDPPTAVNDAYADGKNVVLTTSVATGVLANDSDANGDPLTASVVTSTTSGALVLAADGSFTYTPTPGFTGSDSFIYAASDGVVGSNSTATITVANGAPAAVNDASSGLHDATIDIAAPGVLGNDSDPNGDPLTAVLGTAPTSGTVSVGTDGRYRYVPNPGFVGTDSFTYTARDGAVASLPATVTVTITNGAPAAVDDAWSTTTNGTLTVPAPGVLANDSDADADPLVANLVSGPSNGSLNLGPDGSFGYTPVSGFAGTDTFTYRAGDGIATSAATVTITVTNAAPVAAGDSLSTWRNTVLVLASPGILGNDTDANGDGLTAILASNVANGTLAVASDGSLTYTPNGGFSGSDSFTYRASDGIATSALTTVTIAVTNRAPQAPGTSVTVTHDHALAVPASSGVLAAASDPDGDSLIAVLATNPAHGSVTLQGDGAFDYAPTAGYVGPDTFQATVSDGAASTSVWVSISVLDARPTIVAGAPIMASGSTISEPAPGLLAGAADADGDALSIVVIVPPQIGSLTVNANGGFSYTADPGFSGSDSFSYAASDGIRLSVPVSQTMTIAGPAPSPSSPPVATPAPDPSPAPSPSSPPVATPAPDPSPAPSPSSPPVATPAPDPSPAPDASPAPGLSSSPAATPAPVPGSGPLDGGRAGPGGPNTFTVPAIGGGGVELSGLTLSAALIASLGVFLWAVPGLMGGGVGLLIVLLTVLAQASGGLIWLPLVRRRIGSFGVSRSGPRPGGLA